MAVSQSDIGEERELRELFRKTAGEDLEVDPYELRTILDSNFKHGSVQFINHLINKNEFMYVASESETPSGSHGNYLYTFVNTTHCCQFSDIL